MKSTQIAYVFIAFIGILTWNSFLIKRDQKLFDSYDRVCNEISYKSENCKFSK